MAADRRNSGSCLERQPDTHTIGNAHSFGDATVEPKCRPVRDTVEFAISCPNLDSIDRSDRIRLAIPEPIGNACSYCRLDRWLGVGRAERVAVSQPHAQCSGFTDSVCHAFALFRNLRTNGDADL